MPVIVKALGWVGEAFHLHGWGPFYYSVGPRLEAKREKLLKTCTRESILADLSKNILNNGCIFCSEEVEMLKETFATHAKSDKCWDRQSLESCLSERMPQDTTTQELLKQATSSLWILITYFAEWPFAAALPASRPTSLTFTAWVRAIAFLCGRHSKIFQPWDPEDHFFNRRKERVGETDLPVLEYLFRGLATDIQSLDPIDTGNSIALSPRYTLQRDVLDILNTIEPIIHIYTPRISRINLVPIADRLCSPLAPSPLTSLTIPLETLTPLLGISLAVVQHTTKFDEFSWADQRLGELLETAQIGIRNTGGAITYDVFTRLLSDDIYPNIYDAVALIFTACPSPKIIIEGILFDPFYRLWYPELVRSERRLHLMALREPGYGGGPLEMEEGEN